MRMRAVPPRLPRRLGRAPVLDTALAFALVLLPLVFLNIAFVHIAHIAQRQHSRCHDSATKHTHDTHHTDITQIHESLQLPYLAAAAPAAADEVFFTVFVLSSEPTRSALINANTPVPRSVSVWPTAYLTLSMAVLMDQ